jgi:hypothetical protein
MGGVSKAYYHNNIKLFQTHFGIILRPDLFDYISSLSKIVEIPQSVSELENVYKCETNKIVLCNTAQVEVPQSKWLELLAATYFFIAMPGSSTPLCHNIIEAMSKSTIPVVQYNNFFSHR